MEEITREQARDMAEAHAEGMHAELPREGCPECSDRELRTYPRRGYQDMRRDLGRAPTAQEWQDERR